MGVKFVSPKGNDSVAVVARSVEKAEEEVEEAADAAAEAAEADADATGSGAEDSVTVAEGATIDDGTPAAEAPDSDPQEG
jgi:DNA gyrase subunit A